MRRALRRGWSTLRLRIDCVRVGRILHAHLAGEVSEADARWVADHLEACLHCGMDAELHQRISRSLARHGAVPPQAVTRMVAFGESLMGNPGNPSPPGRPRAPGTAGGPGGGEGTGAS